MWSCVQELELLKINCGIIIYFRKTVLIFTYHFSSSTWTPMDWNLLVTLLSPGMVDSSAPSTLKNPKHDR